MFAHGLMCFTLLCVCVLEVKCVITEVVHYKKNVFFSLDC